jgi:isocitrate dehydrogenase
MDLHACVRPVRYFDGVPAPIIALVKERTSRTIRADRGIGVKPISTAGSKRLARTALEWAVQNRLPSVTLVHKGNIMKFTEGSFAEWGYEVAAREFGDRTVTEKKLWDERGGGDAGG